MTNAPMADIFRGMNWKYMLIWVDDLVIYSPDVETHIEHLTSVFERLKSVNPKLNASKCHFFKKNLKYLGFIIGSNRIIADPDKTEAINSYPAPKNPKSLRTFLGLNRFYCCFVQNYAKLCSPLYKLLHKKTKNIFGTKIVMKHSKL